MKANELRLGNWTLRQGKPHKVLVSDISTMAADGMIYYLKPVPLTEEWLKRLGFEKNWEGNWIMEWDNYVGDRHMMVVILPENIWHDKRRTETGKYGIRLRNHILDSVALDVIESVHELQNITFAIMRKELTAGRPRLTDQ